MEDQKDIENGDECSGRHGVTATKLLKQENLASDTTEANDERTVKRKGEKRNEFLILDSNQGTRYGGFGQESRLEDGEVLQDEEERVHSATDLPIGQVGDDEQDLEDEDGKYNTLGLVKVFQHVHQSQKKNPFDSNNSQNKSHMEGSQQVQGKQEQNFEVSYSSVKPKYTRFEEQNVQRCSKHNQQIQDNNQFQSNIQSYNQSSNQSQRQSQRLQQSTTRSRKSGMGSGMIIQEIPYWQNPNKTVQTSPRSLQPIPIDHLFWRHQVQQQLQIVASNKNNNSPKNNINTQDCNQYITTQTEEQKKTSPSPIIADQNLLNSQQAYGIVPLRVQFFKANKSKRQMLQKIENQWVNFKSTRVSADIVNNNMSQNQMSKKTKFNSTHSHDLNAMSGTASSQAQSFNMQMSRNPKIISKENSQEQILSNKAASKNSKIDKQTKLAYKRKNQSVSLAPAANQCLVEQKGSSQNLPHFEKSKLTKQLRLNPTQQKVNTQGCVSPPEFNDIAQANQSIGIDEKTKNKQIILQDHQKSLMRQNMLSEPITDTVGTELSTKRPVNQFGVDSGQMQYLSGISSVQLLSVESPLIVLDKTSPEFLNLPDIHNINQNPLDVGLEYLDENALDVPENIFNSLQILKTAQFHFDSKNVKLAGKNWPLRGSAIIPPIKNQDKKQQRSSLNLDKQNLEQLLEQRPLAGIPSKQKQQDGIKTRSLSVLESLDPLTILTQPQQVYLGDIYADQYLNKPEDDSLDCPPIKQLFSFPMKDVNQNYRNPQGSKRSQPFSKLLSTVQDLGETLTHQDSPMMPQYPSKLRFQNQKQSLREHPSSSEAAKHGHTVYPQINRNNDLKFTGQESKTQPVISSQDNQNLSPEVPQKGNKFTKQLQQIMMNNYRTSPAQFTQFVSPKNKTISGNSSSHHPNQDLLFVEGKKTLEKFAPQFKQAGSVGYSDQGSANKNNSASRQNELQISNKSLTQSMTQFSHQQRSFDFKVRHQQQVAVENEMQQSIQALGQSIKVDPKAQKQAKQKHQALANTKRHSQPSTKEQSPQRSPKIVSASQIGGDKQKPLKKAQSSLNPSLVRVKVLTQSNGKSAANRQQRKNKLHQRQQFLGERDAAGDDQEDIETRQMIRFESSGAEGKLKQVSEYERQETSVLGENSQEQSVRQLHTQNKTADRRQEDDDGDQVKSDERIGDSRLLDDIPKLLEPHNNSQKSLQNSQSPQNQAKIDKDKLNEQKQGKKAKKNKLQQKLGKTGKNNQCKRKNYKSSAQKEVIQKEDDIMIDEAGKIYQDILLDRNQQFTQELEDRVIPENNRLGNQESGSDLNSKQEYRTDNQNQSTEQKTKELCSQQYRMITSPEEERHSNAMIDHNYEGTNNNYRRTFNMPKPPHSPDQFLNSNEGMNTSQYTLQSNFPMRPSLAQLSELNQLQQSLNESKQLFFDQFPTDQHQEMVALQPQNYAIAALLEQTTKDLDLQKQKFFKFKGSQSIQNLSPTKENVRLSQKQYQQLQSSYVSKNQQRLSQNMSMVRIGKHAQKQSSLRTSSQTHLLQSSSLHSDSSSQQNLHLLSLQNRSSEKQLLRGESLGSLAEIERGFQSVIDSAPQNMQNNLRKSIRYYKQMQDVGSLDKTRDRWLFKKSVKDAEREDAENGYEKKTRISKLYPQFNLMNYTALLNKVDHTGREGQGNISLEITSSLHNQSLTSVDLKQSQKVLKLTSMQKQGEQTFKQRGKLHRLHAQSVLLNSPVEQHLKTTEQSSVFLDKKTISMNRLRRERYDRILEAQFSQASIKLEDKLKGDIKRRTALNSHQNRYQEKQLSGNNTMLERLRSIKQSNQSLTSLQNKQNNVLQQFVDQIVRGVSDITMSDTDPTTLPTQHLLELPDINEGVNKSISCQTTFEQLQPVHEDLKEIRKHQQLLQGIYKQKQNDSKFAKRSESLDLQYTKLLERMQYAQTSPPAVENKQFQFETTNNYSHGIESENKVEIDSANILGTDNKQIVKSYTSLKNVQSRQEQSDSQKSQEEIKLKEKVQETIRNFIKHNNRSNAFQTKISDDLRNALASNHSSFNRPGGGTNNRNDLNLMQSTNQYSIAASKHDSITSSQQKVLPIPAQFLKPQPNNSRMQVFNTTTHNENRLSKFAKNDRGGGDFESSHGHSTVVMQRQPLQISEHSRTTSSQLSIKVIPKPHLMSHQLNENVGVVNKQEFTHSTVQLTGTLGGGNNNADLNTMGNTFMAADKTQLGSLGGARQVPPGAKLFMQTATEYQSKNNPLGGDNKVSFGLESEGDSTSHDQSHQTTHMRFMQQRFQQTEKEKQTTSQTIEISLENNQ